jgi:hypothetical protein
MSCLEACTQVAHKCGGDQDLWRFESVPLIESLSGHDGIVRARVAARPAAGFAIEKGSETDSLDKLKPGIYWMQHRPHREGD